MRAAVGSRAWAVELTEHRGRVTQVRAPRPLCSERGAAVWVYCGTGNKGCIWGPPDPITTTITFGRTRTGGNGDFYVQIHVFIPEYGCRPAIRYDDTHPPTEKGGRGVGRGGGGWSTVLAARRMNVFHLLSVSSNPVPPNHKPSRRCWVMERNCPPGRCRCRRSLSFRRTSRHRWSYLTLRGSLHALT